MGLIQLFLLEGKDVRWDIAVEVNSFLIATKGLIRRVTEVTCIFVEMIR